MPDDNSSLPVPGTTHAPTQRRNWKIPLIGAALVIVLTVILWARNGPRRGVKDTEVDFLLFEKYTTVRWLVLVSVVLGILLDRLFTIWWRRRQNAKESKP